MSKTSVSPSTSIGLHWCHHPRSQRAVDFLLAGVAQGYPALKRAAEHLVATGVIDERGKVLKLWVAGGWVKQ